MKKSTLNYTAAVISVLYVFMGFGQIQITGVRAFIYLFIFLTMSKLKTTEKVPQVWNPWENSEQQNPAVCESLWINI